MFIVNDKALGIFDPTLNYSDCLKLFEARGFGRIPLGEYCLMLGMAQYALRQGVPLSILYVNLYGYADITFEEIPVEDFLEFGADDEPSSN